MTTQTVIETVNFLVSALEESVFMGTRTRMLSQENNFEAVALEPEKLLDLARMAPGGGFSCWEATSIISYLLKEKGIDAKVCLAEGAEPGATNEPHALIRVENDIIIDPYFGIGAVTKENMWQSNTSIAKFSDYENNIFKLRHVCNQRAYEYKIHEEALTETALKYHISNALTFSKENEAQRYRIVQGNQIHSYANKNQNETTFRIWDVNESLPWEATNPILEKDINTMLAEISCLERTFDSRKEAFSKLIS